MFWADKVAKEIKARKLVGEWVDDMKTPSGRIHIGALRGVIIHDLIYRALQDISVKVIYSYVINDFDPMDSLPVYLSAKKFRQHMGKPLFLVPSPVKGFASFAAYFSSEFIEVFNTLGVKPQILWSSQLYKSGRMDLVIKEALNQAEKILEIYQKIAGYPKKKKGWLPLQIICPKCGKLGTTQVFDWDGKTVAFECLPSLVSWAKGCGYKERISPFGGKGKLLWKVDWPAYWKVIGVTIEGAGKDHMSKGGAHDVASAICRQVFGYPIPYKLAYEHFLLGGKKMSSSRGVGSSAKEMITILPPEILRFLMVRTPINRAIDFNPEGYTIANLFDEYDRCAKEFWQLGRKSDLGRVFELSQVGKVLEKPIFLPRFRTVATYVQMPNIDVKSQFEQEKGSRFNTEEEIILNQRIRCAKIWLETYAPKELIYQVSKKIPNAVKKLSPEQKKYLKKALQLIGVKTWQAKDLESVLYEEAKKQKISSQKAFEAIYRAFIGKTSGPKAAWMLLAQNRNFVVKRLKEVIK